MTAVMETRLPLQNAERSELCVFILHLIRCLVIGRNFGLNDKCTADKYT